MSGHAWATLIVVALFAGTTVAICVHLDAHPMHYLGGVA